jgi:hypothetical protein
MEKAEPNNRVHPKLDSTVNFFDRQWPARLTLNVRADSVNSSKQ